MSVIIIRCIYSVAPSFPATDQHPDAVRYQVGSYWADAIGGQPTLAEVMAVLTPPAAVIPPMPAPSAVPTVATLQAQITALQARLAAQGL